MGHTIRRCSIARLQRARDTLVVSRVAQIALERYLCRAKRDFNGEGKTLLAGNAPPDMKAWHERLNVTTASTAAGLRY